MAYTTAIGLHLVFRDGDRVLLGLRTEATGWAGGHWHLPSGHLEDDESATAGACREAREELGVTIAESDLTLSHTFHYRGPDDPTGFLELFFEVARYRGQIRNAEPELCAELRWWPLDGLPDPTVEYTAEGLAAIGEGRPFSAAGWPRGAAPVPPPTA